MSLLRRLRRDRERRDKVEVIYEMLGDLLWRDIRIAGAVQVL